MNSLTTARNSLASILSDAGLACEAFLDERSQPPLCIVIPASNWVENAEEFCEDKIGMQIVAVAKTGTNESRTLELDEMTAKVIETMRDSENDWEFQNALAPGKLKIGNVDYLASIITVSNTTKVETIEES